MTFTTIAIAVALIVFVLAKRVRGEAVREPKKLFLLPLIVGVIGLQNIAHAKLNTVDIAVIAAGAALSLGLGLLRGKFDRVTLVNGSPFMSWSAASVAVFAVNVLAKLALDAGGTRCRRQRGRPEQLHPAEPRAHPAGRSRRRVVPLPVTPAGGRPEPHSGASEADRYRGAVRNTDRPTIWPPIR